MTTAEANQASSWADKIAQVYDFEETQGNFSPELASELVAERETLIPLADLELSVRGLRLISRTKGTYHVVREVKLERANNG